METTKINKALIKDFIEVIWNQNKFSQLDKFLHKNFIDHSLPLHLPANVNGLKEWITITGKAFEHRSNIQEQVTEHDKSIIKFEMRLKHVGNWRGIAPTATEVYTVGYRCFKITDGKIIEHWGLIDGNAIENQLRDSSQGCKVQQ